jgi:hypothetical protein
MMSRSMSVLALFGLMRPSRRCQFTDVKRTSRLGAQVVRINDLLHFHCTPSALESSIGGADPMGSKVAAHASAKNAPMSKSHFIFVIPCFRCAYRLGLGRTFLCD